MDQPKFGKQLAKIRNEKGFTQTELAALCNVSNRTIQRIESGSVTPRSYTVRLLSEALDFDLRKTCSVNEEQSMQSKESKFILSKHVITQATVFFNFKTNRMKKMTFLSIFCTLIGFGVFSFSKQSAAQDSAQLSNYLQLEHRADITQKEAIKLISKISKNASYHKKSLDLLKVYAQKSECNYDTYVLIAKLVGSFSHSTAAAMEIANIAFFTPEDCNLYNEIAPLIFLNNTNTDRYLKLAKEAGRADTEQKRNEVRKQIELYGGQAKFKTIEEAFANQSDI